VNSGQTRFLLLSLATGLAALACGAKEVKRAQAAKNRELVPGVQPVGRISNPRITESSGIVASRQYPGVFWTHNDGGGTKRQVLYAITREGKSLAEFPVTGALLHDWEDIAIDTKKQLYVGDIGNNNARRSQLTVYQIDEPDPKSSHTVLELTRVWRLRFPKAPFDCESLFIWQEHGYVVSKVFNDERAEIYRFSLAETTAPPVLEFVAQLKIDSPVTGADISADGQLLGLVAKNGAYVYRTSGDVARAGQLQPWHTSFRHQHIEGCCFVPEGLLATSESREIYLFTDEAFHLHNDNEK
jgi:hypothetical protein